MVFPRFFVENFGWRAGLGGGVQEECVQVSGSGLDRVQTENCTLCCSTEGLGWGHSSLTIIVFLGLV